MIKYTLWQKIYLSIQVFVSRLMLGKQIRICRFPYYVVNKKGVLFGEGFSAGGGLRIEALAYKNESVVVLGSRVSVGRNLHLAAYYSVVLGNDVLIGSNVLITDHNHGVYGGSVPHSQANVPVNSRELEGAPVRIGNNVWLGDGVVILPGVVIGDNSIIGANSVVTKSIPENTIAVGLPARPIKEFNKISKEWVQIKN